MKNSLTDKNALFLTLSSVASDVPPTEGVLQLLDFAIEIGIPTQCDINLEIWHAFPDGQVIQFRHSGGVKQWTVEELQEEAKKHL